MPDRSLSEWLSYLERLHPSSVELGLERVGRVAAALSLTPVDVPVITIAGTNGKGSVAHSCDAVLRGHDLCVGRFTSPHLLTFNERISVDGEGVDNAGIIDAFEAIEAARGDISLTYFEFSTLAALYCFRERGVDVVVLEVGLGGRLDAVNVVDADIAVITAIDLDHQEWLGETRELIGREKAGIARPGQSVVLAETDYPHTVFDSLDEVGAIPLRAGVEWGWEYEESGQLRIRLSGKAPLTLEVPCPPGLRGANVAAAVQAAALLLGPRLELSRVREALGRLVVPGRRQRLVYDGRELILDVAHNAAAMRALCAWLRAHPASGRSYAALGLLADKDLPAMAAALAAAVDGAYALALPAVARARAPEQVWQALDSAGIAAQQSEFTAEAVCQQLLRGTSEGDRIVFCGSFHTVAGIMAHLEIGPSGSSQPAVDDPA